VGKDSEAQPPPVAPVAAVGENRTAGPSQSALNVIETGSTSSTPDDWFGYAPSGTARVALQLADGRRFASRTIPGWPGSGVVFWGPLTLPTRIAMPYDIVVITYDAAGHVLREVPLIFLG
jgi:hypothetical protein